LPPEDEQPNAGVEDASPRPGRARRLLGGVAPLRAQERKRAKPREAAQEEDEEA